MPLANPVLAPTSTNILINGIKWGDRWQSAGATTTIKIYIASNQNVVFEGQNSAALTPHAAEIAAINNVLKFYENVAKIDFVTATSLADADIYFAIVNETDPTIAAVPGTLGIAMAPDRTVANFQGGVLINRDAYQNGSTASLVTGGYDFVTYLHEFGHALGLAHPHDDGGTSTVFPGVTPGVDQGDLGDFNLNQGIYTMMSYNDSWRLAPHGPVEPGVVSVRGYTGTPMAIDIAALQLLYGSNTTYNNAGTIYTLPSVNAVGTFYSSIWDTGGVDLIRTLSNADAVIDLRAATLLVADGGGGYISYLKNIDGGFTIAKGVVIENATGAGGNDTLIGNTSSNVLTGNGGNDTLNGISGADTFIGGLGSDTYITDGGDTITEAADAGTDTVRSSVTYTLAANLENLTLINAAAITGTGNGLANRLDGSTNTAANVLRGLAGSDIYFVGAGDVVDESVGGSDGIDLVYSAATFSLSDGARVLGSVERLTLTGTANINGTGNALNNLLVGNSGANALNGLTGADIMRGFAGADTYTVDNVGDVVDESIAGSDGTDAILSSISLSLADTAHVKGAIERLTLTGTASIYAIGNTIANVITGNSGNNIIAGANGNDTLTGAGGADHFLFNTALNAATNVDVITDFSVPSDTIRLENAIFTQLTGTGTLGAGLFTTGTATTQADDRILYNGTTGALSYDSDGVGGGAAVRFATLAANLALTNADFFIV